MITRVLPVLSLLFFPVFEASADVLNVDLFQDGSNVVMEWNGSFDTSNLGAPTNTHTLAHQYVADGSHREIYAFGGGSVDSWIDPDLTNAFVPDFMTTDGIRHADLLTGFRWGILDHDSGPANNGELYIQNGYVSGTNISGEMTWLDTDIETLGFTRASGVFTYGDDDSIVINAAVPEPSTAILLLFGGSGWLFFRRRRMAKAELAGSLSS